MSGQQNNNTVNHVNDYEENHETLVHVDIEEEAPGYENVVLSNTLHNDIVQEEADHSQTTNGDLRLKDTVRTASVSVVKRTIILPHQKQILENFFNTGMTSASTQLAHLHEAACDQTGLDLHVIKNWVRNRRRPLAALKKQQEIQQEMQQPQVLTLTVSGLPQTGGSSNNTSIVTIPPPLTVPTPASIISSSTPISSYIPTSSSSPVPSYIPTCISSSSHTPPPLYLPKSKRPKLEGKQQPSSSIVQDPLTVKARIADRDETDFVEVEVERTSYTSLLNNVCEELDVSISDVVKIRKLPNVLIRKDKDVIRMSEGQEIEVVLI